MKTKKELRRLGLGNKKDFTLVVSIGFFLGFLSFIILSFHPYLSVLREVPFFVLFIALMIIIVLCRLAHNKFGLITISALTFSLLTFITPILITTYNQYFFGFFNNLPYALSAITSILIISIVIDIILPKSPMPGKMYEKFTFLEIIVIIIVGVLDFGLLLCFIYVPIAQLGFLLALFSIASTQVLCRLIIDKFGSISLSMIIFSILASTITPAGLSNPLFGELSGLHLIISGFIIGIITDIAVSISCVRNPINIFLGVKQGYISTSYVVMNDYLLRGVVYGIVAPISIAILTTTGDLTHGLGIAIFVGILGEEMPQ